MSESTHSTLYHIVHHSSVPFAKTVRSTNAVLDENRTKDSSSCLKQKFISSSSPVNDPLARCHDEEVGLLRVFLFVIMVWSVASHDFVEEC